MLNIAMVEDDEKAAAELRSALKRYSTDSGTSIRVSAFNLAEAFLSNYKPQYDIVFMDIKLLGMDGMTAAHRLREMDERVSLIFLTSVSQLAIEGYKVNAVDYILKPFNYYDLKLRLDRVCRNLNDGGEFISVAVTREGVRRLKIDDIYYIEASGHRLTWHTAGGGLFVTNNQSLKEAEERLAGKSFIRCSAYCLVNLKQVEAIKGNEINLHGETLRLTRGKKESFVFAWKGQAAPESRQ